MTAFEPANPLEARGLAGVAWRAAMTELADGEWHDRAGVEKAMVKASTLAERTCRDYLRKWSHFGVVATDTGFHAGQMRHMRPPRVALSPLGKAWLDGQRRAA